MATVRRRKARDVTGQVNCLYSCRFIRLNYLINCEANGIKKSGFCFTFMLFVSSVNSGLEGGVGTGVLSCMYAFCLYSISTVSRRELYYSLNV